MRVGQGCPLIGTPVSWLWVPPFPLLPQFGDTPLHYASITGSVSVLRTLLKWASGDRALLNAQNAVRVLSLLHSSS